MERSKLRAGAKAWASPCRLLNIPNRHLQGTYRRLGGCRDRTRQGKTFLTRPLFFKGSL